MYYNQDTKYTDEEERAINDFKLYCIELGKMIPETDQNILAHLYRNKMSNQKAYAALVAKHQYEMSNFPLKITESIYKLIEVGIISISGRDKCHRPVVNLSLDRLWGMNPMPPTEDLITVSLLMIEFIKKYMLIPGQIENRLLIIDCKDMNILNFPYNMVKQITGTMQR